MMPAVLEVAGLCAAAERLRTLRPVATAEDADGACEALRAAREASNGATRGWSDLVAEASFWAEAAVRAARAGDQKLFQRCVTLIRIEMDKGRVLMSAN